MTAAVSWSDDKEIKPPNGTIGKPPMKPLSHAGARGCELTTIKNKSPKKNSVTFSRLLIATSTSSPAMPAGFAQLEVVLCDWPAPGGQRPKYNDTVTVAATSTTVHMSPNRSWCGSPIPVGLLFLLRHQTHKTLPNHNNTTIVVQIPVSFRVETAGGAKMKIQM